MLKSVPYLAGTVLMFAATPAMADWQQTRWGMTTVQVAAVARNTAPARAIIGGGHEAVGRWSGTVGAGSTRRFDFDSAFHFTGNRLWRVRLDLRGGDCRGLFQALVAAHGAARRIESAPGMSEWRVAGANNRIVHLDAHGMCSLEYMPIRMP